jgi:hypothetical protein
MRTGSIFHVLKGINGWSSSSISKLDVAKIISIGYRYRMFAINDPTYNIALTVKYSHNAYGDKHDGIHHEIDIEKRYVKVEDVRREIDEIEEKQNILRKM